MESYECIETATVMESCESMDETDIPMEVLNMEVLDMTVERSDVNIVIDSEEHIVIQGNDDGNLNVIESERSAMGVFMVSSIEEMREIIDDYCERTTSHFVVQKKSKNFGLPSLECDLTGHRVQWADTRHSNSMIDNVVQFDGIPHISVGHFQLNCQFGVDPKASRREKLKDEPEATGKKKRLLKNPTKKCGCPARIRVKQIIKFPEFKILKNTEKRKRTGATKLKGKLKTCRSELQSELLIIGRLPDICEHKYHELMEGREYSKEVIHPDLICRAKELYLQNKSNTEILDTINNYVVKDMFYNQELPHPNRRRYFPNMKDIRNINLRVRQVSRFSKEEETQVQAVINRIRSENPGVNVMLRIDEKNVKGESKNESSEEESENEADKSRKEERKPHTFIFCHQSPLQQKLMKRYGQESVYLVEVKDAMLMKRVLTYKMYALLVQTNVDFQVVGCIITSKQRKEGLVECLNIFREWNTYWTPRYFIVDCCEPIYDAIGECFPNVNYFLNPQSCEEEWLSFIKTPSNDLQDHCEEILTHLRSMQYSLTEDSLTFAAALLEESYIWQSNGKLRQWFQASWLHVAKRWVFGYRPEDMFITQHLKSSVNECIHVYREALSRSSKVNGFVELLESITNNISKEGYENYMKRNQKHYSFYQLYKKNNKLTEHMHGVPMSIIPYVDGTSKMAERNDFLITHEQCGVFSIQVSIMEDQDDADNQVNRNGDMKGKDSEIHVKSLTDCISSCSPSNTPINDRKNEISETEFGCIEYSTKLDAGNFTVSFGDLHSHPFCTCSHWLLYRLPCVHMFAVFCKIPGWKYNMLSPLYRFNPLLDVDISCIEIDKHVTSDRECQVDISHCYCHEDQIFEPPSYMTLLLAVQAKDFLKHVEKMEFLFKNKVLHSALKEQLTDLVDSFSNGVGGCAKNFNPESNIPVKSIQNGYKKLPSKFLVNPTEVRIVDPMKNINPQKLVNPVKPVGSIKPVNPVKAIHLLKTKNPRNVENESVLFTLNVEAKNQEKNSGAELQTWPSRNVIYIQNPNFKIGNDILNVEVTSQTELEAVLKSLNSKNPVQSTPFTKILPKLLPNNKITVRSVENVTDTVGNTASTSISSLLTTTKMSTIDEHNSMLNKNLLTVDRNLLNLKCTGTDSVLQKAEVKNMLSNSGICEKPVATLIIPTGVGNGEIISKCPGPLSSAITDGKPLNNEKIQKIDLLLKSCQATLNEKYVPMNEEDTKRRKLSNSIISNKGGHIHVPVSVIPQHGIASLTKLPAVASTLCPQKFKSKSSFPHTLEVTSSPGVQENKSLAPHSQEDKFVTEQSLENKSLTPESQQKIIPTPQSQGSQPPEELGKNTPSSLTPQARLCKSIKDLHKIADDAARFEGFKKDTIIVEKEIGNNDKSIDSGTMNNTNSPSYEVIDETLIVDELPIENLASNLKKQSTVA